MKITKQQLQQIIKEELLREMDCDDIDDDMQSAPLRAIPRQQRVSCPP